MASAVTACAAAPAQQRGAMGARAPLAPLRWAPPPRRSARASRRGAWAAAARTDGGAAADDDAGAAPHAQPHARPVRGCRRARCRAPLRAAAPVRRTASRRIATRRAAAAHCFARSAKALKRSAHSRPKPLLRFVRAPASARAGCRAARRAAARVTAAPCRGRGAAGCCSGAWRRRRSARRHRRGRSPRHGAAVCPSNLIFRLRRRAGRRRRVPLRARCAHLRAGAAG
jgi:hypothetical protein